MAWLQTDPCPTDQILDIGWLFLPGRVPGECDWVAPAIPPFLLVAVGDVSAPYVLPLKPVRDPRSGNAPDPLGTTLRPSFIINFLLMVVLPCVRSFDEMDCAPAFARNPRLNR